MKKARQKIRIQINCGIKTSDRFLKQYQTSPDETNKKVRQAYTQFKRDPQYSTLHFKRVYSGVPIYSARITKDYKTIIY